MKPKYWAIIILGALAVIAGTIYYIKQPALDLGPITIRHQLKTSQTPATTTPEAEISGWKTYKNENYGFTINYPAFLIESVPSADELLYKSGDWIGIFQVYDNKNINVIIGEVPGLYNFFPTYEQLKFAAKSNTVDSPDNYAGPDAHHFFSVNAVEETTIDGLPALKIIQCEAINCAEVTIGYFVYHDNKVLELAYSIGSLELGREDEIPKSVDKFTKRDKNSEEIISTFKFTK